MRFSRIFIVTFAVTAAVIAIGIWMGFERTKGNYLAPQGKIGRVRVQKIEDTVAIAVLDFSLRNESDREMTVRYAMATVEAADGSKTEGINASASDAPKLFNAYPLLAPQFNPVLRDRDKVLPHQELDRMIIARFDIPWDQMEKRKAIQLRIEDVTGPAVTMTGK